MGKYTVEVEFYPGDISPYLGTLFVTEHGEYSLDWDGRIYGRPSLEGAQVALVAGIRPQDYGEVRSYLEEGLKQAFDSLILRKGVKPERGLYLAISITEKETNRRRRNGLVTSALRDVIQPA